MAIDLPVHHHTPLYQQVWTIDETQREEVNAFLKEQGVTWEYLDTVLSSHKAAKIQFGSVAKSTPLVSPPVEKREALPECLWEDDVVEVLTPKDPQSSGHLWVALKRPVDYFYNVMADELLKLRETVAKIQKILREVFHRETYVFQKNESSPQTLSNRFVIEVIPPTSLDVYDVEEKVDCNNRTLWKGLFPSTLPSPSKEEIQEANLIFKKALPESDFTFSQAKTPEPFQHAATPKEHEAQAIDMLRNCIFQLLQERFSILKEESPEEINPPQDSIKAQASCVFCNPKITENESLYETELSWVLYNARPSFPFHFLILPKRHVRSSEDLREDEMRDICEIAQKLTKVLVEEEGCADTFLFTQDGPTVAQKIPHSHFHVAATRSRLQYFLFQMNYNKEPFLTQEQMQPILEKFRRKMQQADEDLSASRCG